MSEGKQTPPTILLRPSKSFRILFFVCLLVLLLLPLSQALPEDDLVRATNDPQSKLKSKAKDRQHDVINVSRKPQKFRTHQHYDNDMMMEPPRPTVSQVSSNSAVVSWSLPPSTGLPIVFMRIQFRELNPRRKIAQILWNTVDDDISPSTTSYVVKKLKTGATYLFRLAAVYSNNDNRHGPNSDKFLVETPDQSKPLVFGPTIVELKALSPYAISISWQMIEPHVPVSGFIIQYQVYSDSRAPHRDQRRHIPTENLKGADIFQEVNITNPKKKSSSIKGLQPSTPYTVRMLSYSKDGRMSAISNSAVTSTLQDRKSKEISTFPEDDDDNEDDPLRQRQHDEINGHILPPQKLYKSNNNNNDDFHDNFPSRNSSHDPSVPREDLNSESTDELREVVDLLKNERMLLIIACSILAVFLILMSLCLLLFVCLRNKFVFVVPFSKKVYNNPQLTGREIRTF